MKFCDNHWDALRAAIDARGLSHLIAPSAAIAAAQAKQELQQGPSPVTYDPLMAAHWAILGNVTAALPSDIGLYLLMDAPEDPVVGYGPEYDGRTWPRCPLCYLNLAHEVSCTEPRCTLTKKNGYDFWITRAADDQVARVAAMEKAA